MTFTKRCGKRELHGEHYWALPSAPNQEPKYGLCPGWTHSRASRLAALPIRGLDWLLRKAIR